MRVTITIEAEKAAQLLDNSIHLGNHIGQRLREKRVPVTKGIVPVIDASRATGSLTVTTNPDRSIKVIAEWQDTDDDDL
jgi:hypothetical protein